MFPKMNLPRITLVTPSFQQADFLEETIKSVLSQNYPNLEYIVIDGGSTDGSIDIIKKYAAQLSYWESCEDRGQSHAINKGWQRATGDLIGWLNSDDLLLPNALYEVAAAFEANPKVSLVYAGNLIFGAGFKSYVDRGTRKNFEIENLARMNLPQQSAFYRRKVIEEQGFLDESLHYCMDFDLFIRIFLNYELAEADGVWAAFRQHKKSKTNTMLMGFFADNQKIMSRLLRSFDHTKDLIPTMKSLNLYVKENTKYSVSRPYSKKDIHQAWLLYLEEVATALRYDLQYDWLKRILKYLKKNHLEFYTQSKKIKRVRLLRHVPVFFILFFRKIKQIFE